MNESLRALWKILDRWSRQTESALGQMSYRRSFIGRLGGIAKADRAEAKYLLLAIAPVIPLMISDEAGWDRNLLWYVWACLSIAWAIVIGTLSLLGYWRHFRRYLNRKP